MNRASSAHADAHHHGLEARAKVRVKLFAAIRDAFGVDVVEVDAATVGDLAKLLAARCPAAGGLIERSRFAVNQAFVPAEARLSEKDEVAVIPPVSGG